jgi:hypothetical protein
VRIIATIAPFDAEYAVWPKLARCPAGDPTRISRVATILVRHLV